MTAEKSRAPVSVELFESEAIVGRGRRTTVYEVALNDGWVAARAYPGARMETLDARAGTVWERRLELELAVGTRVDRVVTEPATEPRRNALEQLGHAHDKAKRRIRRTELRVGRRGDLVSVRRPG